MLDTTSRWAAWSAYRNPAPLTADEAKRRWELMVADGTAAHSPAAWRMMSRRLLAAGLDAAPGTARSLLDRALDCAIRARSSRAS